MSAKQLTSSRKILGVQFRGQEINTLRTLFAATKKQMRDTFIRLIERFDFNSVFIMKIKAI